MYPAYDIREAKRKSEALLGLDLSVIERARDAAFRHRDMYSRGVDEYCKYLAQHAQFVRRNVEWDRNISFERVYVWYYGQSVYRITVMITPSRLGEALPERSKVLGVFTFPPDEAEEATAFFFDILASNQPRYISLYRSCIGEVLRGIEQIGHSPDLRHLCAAEYRVYRFIDVVKLALDTAIECRNAMCLFDIEGI